MHSKVNGVSTAFCIFIIAILFIVWGLHKLSVNGSYSVIGIGLILMACVRIILNQIAIDQRLIKMTEEEKDK